MHPGSNNIVSLYVLEKILVLIVLAYGIEMKLSTFSEDHAWSNSGIVFAFWILKAKQMAIHKTEAVQKLASG